MQKEDIRWRQRFHNFQKAFQLLESAVLLAKERPLTELEEQGLIQRFEFTHELAWNVMKDYFEYQGNTNITGSRDAIREAFNKTLIENGEGWMEMIRSRNQSSHTYNEKIANEILEKIITVYYALFQAFNLRMTNLQL
jgi:nucleotidyltransferase substrate binding protein (TIGR01987 family)